MAGEIKALREGANKERVRVADQRERTDIQQERIELAARELADISERLQAADALRESL